MYKSKPSVSRKGMKLHKRTRAQILEDEKKEQEAKKISAENAARLEAEIEERYIRFYKNALQRLKEQELNEKTEMAVSKR